MMTEQLRNILKKHGVTELVIADVGAKDSLDYIHELAGITSLHAFEPNPVEYRNLELKYKTHPFRSLQLNQTGLAEKEGTAQFHITEHAAMSSLLQPDIGNYERHFGSYRDFERWKEYIRPAEHISIELHTADTYFKNSAIDYLKLDTQGSELSVLKGATGLLANKKIQVIKVEVSTIPVYKDQALFSDIDLFLRDHHYTLVDFITYRNDYTPIWNQDKAHSHYAPCGDAIYVLEDDASSVAFSIKRGILLYWLGYPGLADSWLNKAGLSANDISIIRSIKSVKYKSFRARLFKNIMPPFLYRLMERMK
jgi:FkbM family methyltransferase